MELALGLLSGLVVGVVVAFVWQRSLAGARNRSEEAMRESFKALSTDVLSENRQAFLDLAHTRFGQLEQVSKAESEAREKAVRDIVEPIRANLGTLSMTLQGLEQKRSEDHGSLKAMMGTLQTATSNLQSETRVLATAMRDTRARGSWGELQLRRIVELAGMLEYCDFVEQGTFSGEDGRLRPDLVVRLPGAKTIVIDAKVPLQAYLEAVESSDPDREASRLADHARAVAGHVGALAARKYDEYVPGTVDFVVMFVPGDVFLTAALEKQPALLEDAIAKGVFLATPITLIALLKAIAYGWRQEQLAENAQEIATLGATLYDRVALFAEHFAKVGSGLDAAVSRYNDAVGSLEGRLLVTARQIAERGASKRREIPDVGTIDRRSRGMTAPELAEASRADLDAESGDAGSGAPAG